MGPRQSQALLRRASNIPDESSGQRQCPAVVVNACARRLGTAGFLAGSLVLLPDAFSATTFHSSVVDAPESPLAWARSWFRTRINSVLNASLQPIRAERRRFWILQAIRCGCHLSSNTSRSPRKACGEESKSQGASLTPHRSNSWSCPKFSTQAAAGFV